MYVQKLPLAIDKGGLGIFNFNFRLILLSEADSLSDDCDLVFLVTLASVDELLAE